MYQTPPCTRGWPCKAFCCGIFTLWDRDSFQRAEELGLFRRYNCKIVKLIGGRNRGYYIFPLLKIFQRIKKEATEREIEELMCEAIIYAVNKRIKWIKCVFLNRENKCAIYEYRPIACRIFGTSLLPNCPIMEGGRWITF